MKKWLCIAALAATTSAHAADWITIADSQEATLAIDRASITEDKGVRHAWSMWNFKEARTNAGDNAIPPIKSYKNEHLFNCKDKTMRLAKEIIYTENDGKGKSQDNSAALAEQPFSTPKPKTIGHAMLESVCEYKIGKK